MKYSIFKALNEKEACACGLLPDFRGNHYKNYLVNKFFPILEFPNILIYALKSTAFSTVGLVKTITFLLFLKLRTEAYTSTLGLLTYSLTD